MKRHSASVGSVVTKELDKKRRNEYE